MVNINFKYIITVIIGIIIGYFIFGNNKKIIEKKIKVPSTYSYFDYIQPSQKTINIDSLKQLLSDSLKQSIPPKIKKEIEIINLAEKERKKLNDKYLALENEYERFKLFQEFNQVRKFEQYFEDKYTKSKVTIFALGKIQSLNLEVDVKERTINTYTKQIKQKRWSLGPAFIYDPLNNNFSIAFSLQYGVIMF